MSQPQPPPQLTPASLFDSQTRLDTLRLATYNRLLSAIHQKIKWASTQPTSGQLTYYDVPEWSPGCPRYDVKDAILYLVWNLRNSGFKVLYMGQNRLLIHWKEQSIQYYTEDSPIRQAMMAAQQPQVQAQRQGQGQVKAEKKNTAAYRPDGVAGLLTQPRRSASGSASQTVTFI